MEQSYPRDLLHRESRDDMLHSARRLLLPGWSVIFWCTQPPSSPKEGRDFKPSFLNGAPKSGVISSRRFNTPPSAPRHSQVW